MSALPQGRRNLPIGDYTHTGAWGATTTITAGTGLTITKGNLLVSAGTITSSGNITAQGASTITAGTGGFVGTNALYRPNSSSMTSDARAGITGVSNSLYGVGTGISATFSGTYNAIFGCYAGRANTTGSNNSMFGASAGVANTTGSNNSMFGTAAGIANTTGSNNSMFGNSAGAVNTEGAENSFFGGYAGYLNSTGSRNCFFGFKAGFRNSTSSDLLLVDNRDRTSAALELANSIVYGVMGAAAANQEIRFNVGKMGFFATEAQSKPTITGSRDGNAAVASLLTNLATLGLLTDMSS